MTLSLFQEFARRNALTDLLKQADKIYLTPNIPLKKIQGAMHYMPLSVKPDEVWLLADETLFGSARAGLCLTRTALYIKCDFEEPVTFTLDRIRSIHAKPGMINHDLMVNDNLQISFSQLDRNTVRILAEFLWQYVQFSQQSESVSPDSHSEFPDAIQAMVQLYLYLALKQEGKVQPETEYRLLAYFFEMNRKQVAELKQLIRQQKAEPFATVRHRVEQKLSTIPAEKKRLILTFSVQLMVLNKFGYADFEYHLDQIATAINIGMTDLEQVMRLVFDETPSRNTGTSNYPAEVMQACQLLDILPHQLTMEILQKAYRKKIAEFHPDQYQTLPVAVRSLIEEQAQQLNQARATLKLYLQG